MPQDEWWGGKEVLFLPQMNTDEHGKKQGLIKSPQAANALILIFDCLCSSVANTFLTAYPSWHYLKQFNLKPMRCTDSIFLSPRRRPICANLIGRA